jgi:cytochrome oxidase Cu insertion factor (SCO1/SenC/PrrC family)
VATVCAVLACAPSAFADGDPASDFLLTQKVFLTSQSSSMTASQRELTSLVAAANRAGFPIRVAIISDEYNLGSITELWLKPRVYAKFLGIELGMTHAQRLLVVMPNGFGFYWPGHALGTDYALLSQVGLGRGPDGLAASASAALRRLAAASGVKLDAAPVATVHSGRSAGSGEGLLITAIALCVLLVGAGAVGMVRRRRPRPRMPSPSAWLKPRVAVPGFALVLIVATGAVVVLIRGLPGSGTSGANARSIVTAPARSWPAGAVRAPAFLLRDENGRPLALSRFRGRPVILTFVDPLCRNLCPLEAHLLNEVVGSMPAAARPAIVAVSVDIWADKRADLIQDNHRWSLVPQWHWAVGGPKQLEAVWRRYKIGVSVVRKHIDNTTINYITHIEAAYVIDATGHVRALFGWPFYPQDLEHVLHALT